MRRLPLFLIACVLAASCGNADTIVTGPALAPDQPAASPEPATATVNDVVDDVPDAVADDPPISTELTRYGWVTSYVFVDPTTGELIDWSPSASFVVDREQDTAFGVFDYSTLPTSTNPIGWDRAELAYVDGVVMSRGVPFWPTRADEPEFDEDAWYFRDLDAQGLPDLLGDDASAASLLQGIDLPADAVGTPVEVTILDITRAASETGNFWAALKAADALVAADLTIQVNELDGRVSSIELVPVPDVAVQSLTIEFTYDAEPFEVPDAAVGIDPPTMFQRVIEPEPETDPEPEAWTTDTVEPYLDVLFRLNAYLGPDTDVSLTPEGELVIVGRTDVFAGPDDFTSWQLNDDGMNRLLAAIQTNEVVASGIYNVGFDHGLSLEVGRPPAELNAHPDHGTPSPDERAAIEELLAALVDPAWLGDGIVSGPHPWVPDDLTVYVTPQAVADAEPWPLAQTVAELATTSADGELVMCLTGEDAAAFWPLLGDGVNHAYLPIDDGSATYDATVSLNWPGYRLYGDPCAPEPTFGVEVGDD